MEKEKIKNMEDKLRFLEDDIFWMKCKMLHTNHLFGNCCEVRRDCVPSGSSRFERSGLRKCVWRADWGERRTAWGKQLLLFILENKICKSINAPGFICSASLKKRILVVKEENEVLW